MSVLHVERQEIEAEIIQTGVKQRIMAGKHRRKQCPTLRFFHFTKNEIINVKSARHQRSMKNKPLPATRQPPNLKRLLTRAGFKPEEELGVKTKLRPLHLRILKSRKSRKLNHQLGQLCSN